MDEVSIFHDQLEFVPQNLHLSIWKAKSTDIKGIITGFHGLSSHASLCYHYFGPYMAEYGWTTIAIDMPGLGHWIPENKKAEKNHWSMNIEAMSSLIKKCKNIAPDKKLALVGVSMGALNIIEYIFNQNEAHSILPDFIILAVPALRASIPFYIYPIMIPLSIFAPNVKIGLKRFEPEVKSNDPKSIINYEDSHALKKISVGYAACLYSSMQKIKFKKNQNPMDKWPKNIPLLMLTAGQDTVTNTEYSHFFYHMLPRDICSQYINYPKAHHYLFYEDNRNEIFEDILQFLSKNI